MNLNYPATGRHGAGMFTELVRVDATMATVTCDRCHNGDRVLSCLSPTRHGSRTPAAAARAGGGHTQLVPVCLQRRWTQRQLQVVAAWPPFMC